MEKVRRLPIEGIDTILVPILTESVMQMWMSCIAGALV